ncbi:pilus assembly protein PilM [Mycoplasmatota bacterium WC44]
MKKLHIYFTDTDFIFVEKRNGLSSLNDYGSVKLPEGYIKNGVIEKFDELVGFVEGVLDRTKVKSSRAHLLLHEKIVDYKKFALPEGIKENKVSEYINSKVGDELILPFNDPVIDYKYTNINGYPEAIIFSVSKEVINLYTKLLERVGLKIVKTDVPALAIHKAFHVTRNGITPFEDETMFVNVYANIISINVFRRQYPFFNIIAESGIEFKKENYKDIIQNVQDEIYRMNNYYEWNVNKGKVKIKKAIIVPLTSDEEFDALMVKQIIADNMTGISHLSFYNPNDENNLYNLNIKYLLTMSSSLI